MRFRLLSQYVGVPRFPPGDPAAVKILREKAAKWGADGVFVVRDQELPGVGRKLIGVAIRTRP